MLSLPTELYRPIVESITDKPTLYSLLFASSIFNNEAARVIYRKVSPRGRTNQEKLFQLLHSSGHLGRHVLEFHLILNAVEVNLGDLPYWSSLSLTLRCLINLKALRIWYSASKSDVVLGHIFDGCVFQLENFSWPFPLEEKLLNFLESQRRIQRLNVAWPLSKRVSSEALPQLSVLTGGSSVINALLPGRQVTHLRWIPTIFGEEPDVVRIGPSLNNIRVLKYAESFHSSQLRKIISYLGKLEVLEWNQPNCQEIVDNASLFSHLRKITLLFTPSYPETVIGKLFASIPTLLLVDSWVGRYSFRRSRGSDIVQPILIPPDDWMF